MTKRAELAAAELAHRGRSIGEHDDSTQCQKCCGLIKHSHNYCPTCGEKIANTGSQSVLDDIEAAIVAAMGAGS